jgi:rare lipoprotein A
MSIRCARTSNVRVETYRVRSHGPVVPGARARKAIPLMAAALAAALLAACAQSPAVTEKPGLRTTHRPVATNRHAAAVRKHTPYAPNTSRHVASHGVASFYTAGTLTANGERFDTNQLTAAHPTLPFGTRLRVTNVATGQSVTVRVNDRGPFTRGRIVDVSYSAAESLGMVGNGVAKVKLDVVQ